MEDVISFQTYRPKVMSFGSSVGRMDGFGTSIGKIDGFGHQPESDGYGSSAEKVIVTGYQPKGVIADDKISDLSTRGDEFQIISRRLIVG